MLQYNPWIADDAKMNKALDACHKAGIGLISMKQVAGHTDLEKIGKAIPDLQEKGLTPYQALLHAIWTDERSASCCVSMRNTDQVRENADAARVFKPLTKAEIDQLRDACIAAGPTLCADCDGRCCQAAGTQAELGNLTRFLTYHEHHGYRGEARRLYAALPDAARDWAGADLEAARQPAPTSSISPSSCPRPIRSWAERDPSLTAPPCTGRPAPCGAESAVSLRPAIRLQTDTIKNTQSAQSTHIQYKGIYGFHECTCAIRVG